LKNPYRPTAKGNYWTVTTSVISRDLLTRQNTLVSRFAQDTGYSYRKDLTEVFDSVSGSIKITIPQHLLNGTELIDDPAAVMEALLLEPKSDEDQTTRINVMSNPSGKTYSLVDLFDQEDCLDDDIGKRQPYGTGANKWLDKAPKIRKNSVSSKPVPVAQVSPQQSYPISASSYTEKVESSHVVVEMLRNAMVNPRSITQSQSQQQLLTQAISASGQVSTLPLLLNICNSVQQASFTVRPSVEMRSHSSIAPMTSQNSPDSLASPVQAISFIQTSKSPPPLVPKWNQRSPEVEEPVVVVDQANLAERRELQTSNGETIILAPFNVASTDISQDFNVKEKHSSSSFENENAVAAPFLKSLESSVRRGERPQSNHMMEQEVKWLIKNEKESDSLKYKRDELVSPSTSTEAMISPVSNGEIPDSPDVRMNVFPTIASCPATIE